MSASPWGLVKIRHSDLISYAPQSQSFQMKNSFRTTSGSWIELVLGTRASPNRFGGKVVVFYMVWDIHLSGTEQDSNQQRLSPHESYLFE